MYTSFYGFREKPFNIVPDPGFLYLSPKHRMALTHLEYGLMDRIGFIVLTGEIGAGKTTIVKQFLNQLDGDTDVAVIFNTNVTGEQLLELVLNEFQVDTPVQGKATYINALNRFLIDKYGLGRKALLIVDEAQNLGEEGLEEIRMLSNLHTDKDTLLQIMLVGQPGLRVNLEKPSLAQLKQRVGVSYHIAPLSLDETREYIDHRLERAGAVNPAIFTPEAVALIFQHSAGIPRTINILCDGALVYGYADELKTIEAPVVEQLIEDRQGAGGLTQPAGEPAVASASKEPSREASVYERLGSMEGQVGHLSAMLEMLAREHEGKAAQQSDVLVRKLEILLAEERRRADELSIQCDILRQKLDTTETREEPGPAEQSSQETSAEMEISALKERDKAGWTKRFQNLFRRWFVR
jgi:general secretion pathway protein A